ncbi:DNA-processing protein DprA [Kibdelosporangium phytohabitans]|nr:DNA-processing protein DprA [Kibdelosporangium phytohabitans]
MSTLEDIRFARAYLMRVAEPPAPYLTQLVAEAGAVAAAERVRTGALADRVRAETDAQRHLTHRDVEIDLARGHQTGARLLIPEDADWPADALVALTQAHARGLSWAVPPLGLWVQGTGRLRPLLRRAVAVVGARSATSYGTHIAAEIADGLAERNITVMSASAEGVDRAAHLGALVKSGATIAALGHGIDRSLSRRHRQLLERVAEGGLVISEYPPGAPPARRRFAARNRLIAVLTSGTVVVEAGQWSAWLDSATSVTALGRTLMAVPGPVTSAMSFACHRMIRDRIAVLVASAADVAQSVSLDKDETPIA